MRGSMRFRETIWAMLEQIRTIALTAPRSARLVIPIFSVANDGTTEKNSAATDQTAAPVAATRANALRMSLGTLGRGTFQLPPRGVPGSGIASTRSASATQNTMPTR